MFEVDRIRKINGLIVGGGGGDGLGGLSLCSSAWLLILICAQPRSAHTALRCGEYISCFTRYHGLSPFKYVICLNISE